MLKRLFVFVSPKVPSVVKLRRNKLDLKKKNNGYVDAYSMTEILIVLCIIGILLLMVLPSQTSVISQAKSIEAQSMLNHLYGLEKNYFFRHSRYSADFEELGFEPALTIEQGGQAVYNIQIIEASTNSFKATATSLSDFDGDGNFNTWEIDHKKSLKEIVRD